MVGTFFAGAVLVAAPLYFWRRPQATEPPAPAGESTSTDPAKKEGGNQLSTGPVSVNPTLAASQATPPTTNGSGAVKRGRISFDELRRSCADSSVGSFPQTDCSPIPSLEKYFHDAVAENAACVPGDASGSLPLVLTADFRKKKPLSLMTQKRGRTLKRSVATACAETISKALSNYENAEAHEHKRYRFEWTVSYAPSETGAVP